MIALTREVRFSVDRDWAGRIEFTRPITNSWAGWPSAVGLVPYLRLRLTVAGEPDSHTGYLCNIHTLDELIRREAIPRAASELHCRGWHLSAEQLLVAVWRHVRAHTPPPATAQRMELLVTPFLRYAVTREHATMVTLTQQFEFSAAHRLHVSSFSDEENRQIFGKCNNLHGHGHNYIVEVTVAGEPDPQTGAVLPLPEFEQIVATHVIEPLDHTHLNRQVAAFERCNPTVENIARVVWDLLADRVCPARLSNVRVYETQKTWADYGGSK